MQQSKWQPPGGNVNRAALLGAKIKNTRERFVFLEGNIFTLRCHRSTLMGFYFDGFFWCWSPGCSGSAGTRTESRSGFFFWQNIDVRGGGPGCSLSCRCSMKPALNKVGCQWGPGGDFDRKTQGSCLETQVLWLGGKSVRRQAMFQADGEQVTQRWLWFCDQCFLVLQKLPLINDNKCFRSQIQHHVRTEVENKSLFY